MKAIQRTASVSNVPAVVQTFFAAVNRFNAEQAAKCFTLTATVHDEDRDHRGRQGIVDWIADKTAKFQPTFTPLRAFVAGNRVTSAVAVAGRFPGSPVTLDFEFQLRGSKIFTLIIV